MWPSLSWLPGPLPLPCPPSPSPSPVLPPHSSLSPSLPPLSLPPSLILPSFFLLLQYPASSLYRQLNAFSLIFSGDEGNPPPPPTPPLAPPPAIILHLATPPASYTRLHNNRKLHHLLQLCILCFYMSINCSL